MKQGFLLFEVALSLLLISTLWAIIICSLGNLMQWQTAVRERIIALDYACRCCELLKQGVLRSNSGKIDAFTDNRYGITITKKPLESVGNWAIFLDDDERKQLSNFQCAYINVEWQTGNNKRSCWLKTGWHSKRVRDGA